MTATLDGLTSMYGLAGCNKNHTLRKSMNNYNNGLSSAFHMLGMSDSLGGGWDGTSYSYDTNIFRSMGRKMSGTVLGVPGSGGFAGGVQFLGGDSAGNVAGNVTLAGGAFSQLVWLAMNGAGQSIQVQSVESGDKFSFVYLDLFVGTMAWDLDGVAQTPLTMSNTGGMKIKTITGLSNGTHTIKLYGQAAKNMGLVAIWCLDTTKVSPFYVHTAAFGGSRANSGTATMNWSNTTSTGLGSVVPTALALFGLTSFDLVICCAGSNDIANGIAHATAAAGLATMRNYFSSSYAVLVAEPLVAGVGVTVATQAAFIADVYSQGVSLNAPVFDLDNYWGAGTSGDGNATAQTDGYLSSTDHTHPLQTTQEVVGTHMADAFLALAA